MAQVCRCYFPPPPYRLEQCGGCREPSRLEDLADAAGVDVWALRSELRNRVTEARQCKQPSGQATA